MDFSNSVMVPMRGISPAGEALTLTRRSSRTTGSAPPRPDRRQIWRCPKTMRLPVLFMTRLHSPARAARCRARGQARQKIAGARAWAGRERFRSCLSICGETGSNVTCRGYDSSDGIRPFEANHPEIPDSSVRSNLSLPAEPPARSLAMCASNPQGLLSSWRVQGSVGPLPVHKSPAGKDFPRVGGAQRLIEIDTLTGRFTRASRMAACVGIAQGNLTTRISPES